MHREVVNRSFGATCSYFSLLDGGAFQRRRCRHPSVSTATGSGPLGGGAPHPGPTEPQSFTLESVVPSPRAQLHFFSFPLNIFVPVFPDAGSRRAPVLDVWSSGRLGFLRPERTFQLLPSVMVTSLTSSGQRLVRLHIRDFCVASGLDSARTFCQKCPLGVLAASHFAGSETPDAGLFLVAVSLVTACRVPTGPDLLTVASSRFYDGRVVCGDTSRPVPTRKPDELSAADLRVRWAPPARAGAPHAGFPTSPSPRIVYIPL